VSWDVWHTTVTMYKDLLELSFKCQGPVIVQVQHISYAKPWAKTALTMWWWCFCIIYSVSQFVCFVFLEAFQQELNSTGTKYALFTKFCDGLASGLDEYARSTGCSNKAAIDHLSTIVCCHCFTCKYKCTEQLWNTLRNINILKNS